VGSTESGTCVSGIFCRAWATPPPRFSSFCSTAVEGAPCGGGKWASSRQSTANFFGLWLRLSLVSLVPGSLPFSPSSPAPYLPDVPDGRRRTLRPMST
jgi:hypothetical protein